MQYYGHTGFALHIDLTNGKSRTIPLKASLLSQFIGGCGVGERLLYDILEPNTPPLSPGNVIVISAGVLVGTPVLSANRILLLTKSATPANKEGTKFSIGRSAGGSRRFGFMMKNAGYDQIIITGRANKPSYLAILSDEVQICDAADLWGKDIYRTSEELLSRHKGGGVLAIGKGGENLVAHSIAFIDGQNSIGRSGGATIMGAKNLKAIVIYGNKKVKVWDPEALVRLIKQAREQAKECPRFKEPSQSKWTLGSKWTKYYPPEIYHDMMVKGRSCSSCIMRCKSLFEVKTGEFQGDQLLTSIFMAVPVYGRKFEFTDYREAMEILIQANKLGVCFMTFMGMARFLVKLYERGIIGKNDTDGLELRMGDFSTCLKLLCKTANREGIGDAMADGWYALSRRVGVDASEDADGDAIVKGNSALFDARFTPFESCRFECMVNPRGGMHNHPVTYFPNKTIHEVKSSAYDLSIPQEAIERIFTDTDFNIARLNRHVEDAESVYFSLGICVTFVMDGIYSLKNLAEYYQTVTGIKVGPEELKRAGERIWNVYKLLNVREGFSRVDDKCPELWASTTESPLKTSVGQIRLKDYLNRPLARNDIERLLDDYYDERGWNISTGVPTKKKLDELGLGSLGKQGIWQL